MISDKLGDKRDLNEINEIKKNHHQIDVLSSTLWVISIWATK